MQSLKERPKVKFCGMTRSIDVQYAVDLGVDAIGMILVPGSPRGVDIESAAQLRALIPSTILSITVVKDPTVEFVNQIIAEVKPDIIQFHGDESPNFCRQFGVPFWKAIAVRNETSVRQMTQIFSNADGILFDSWSIGGSGGQGMGFNWALIPQATKKPHQLYILAGGLDPENVHRAKALLSQGVVNIIDVSSGIEEVGDKQVKGVKSTEKMDAFFEAFQSLSNDIRGAEAALL